LARSGGFGVYVVIHGRTCRQSERVSVQEADDLKRLSVRVCPIDAHQAAAALADSGLGRFDGRETVALSVEQLRQASRATVAGADWQARFDAMLAYAAGRRWVTGDGASVRAHVTWSDEDGCGSG